MCVFVISCTHCNLIILFIIINNDNNTNYCVQRYIHATNSLTISVIILYNDIKNQKLYIYMIMGENGYIYDIIHRN